MIKEMESDSSLLYNSSDSGEEKWFDHIPDDDSHNFDETDDAPRAAVISFALPCVHVHRLLQICMVYPTKDATTQELPPREATLVLIIIEDQNLSTLL